MKKGSIFLGIMAILAFIAAIPAQSSSLFSPGNKEPTRVEVNNRILAKVNGKLISVMDVMKKMDIVLHQKFPQYVNSANIRYQFYTTNWKHVLKELIDKELILIDAAEMKIEVTHGDVRQEMEDTFGPNVMATLDKMGLTYQEAWEIVSSDLLIRRMLYARVNMRAFAKVHPKGLRSAYDQFCEDNRPSNEWVYQVISIRDTDPSKGANIAAIAQELIQSGCPFEDIPLRLQGMDLGSTASVTVSELFTHSEESISPIYKDILVTLQPGSYSSPVAQHSRSQGSPVHRIFYLKDKVEKHALPFQEVEEGLKNQILGMAIDEETERYLKKLRADHIDEEALKALTPDDFQPFSLS